MPEQNPGKVEYNSGREQWQPRGEKTKQIKTIPREKTTHLSRKTLRLV
jgi:hypothetical protein